MAHVLNGDMVTLTLIQGVINTFVIFFAQIVSELIDKYLLRGLFSDEGSGVGGGIAYSITYMIMQTLFSILSLVIIMYFSRIREYRADADGARIVGKESVLLGLKRLQLISHTHALPQDGKLKAFKIA